MRQTIHTLLRISLVGLVAAGILTTFTALNAQETESEEDLIARGQYLTEVASCITCHTPLLEQYNDLAATTLEDLQVLALFERNAFDTDERLLAGGRPFDLGPAGLIISPNLTPDEETGLGTWTAEEIKTAIQLGIHKDGRQLHPLMPSHLYYNMADADLDAIVAFLQSLEPVENMVPDPQTAIPPRNLEPPEEPIVAPDPTDTEARGMYLMTSVLPCQECHTPLDPATGAPVFEMYLAGGQPVEGPWGIVYPANITAHEDTGIGDWTDDEVLRAFIAGVRIDGRRLVLMPWQDYASLTSDDAAAVLHYLRNNVPAVDNEVPAAALQEGFEVYVELDE
jgi:mono/diheme cytochrome c family protein